MLVKVKEVLGVGGGEGGWEERWSGRESGWLIQGPCTACRWVYYVQIVYIVCVHMYVYSVCV
jgi:hypothetical protein